MTHRTYLPLIALAMLAASPAAAEKWLPPIPPAPASETEIAWCARDLACASYWISLDDDLDFIVLPEPRANAFVKATARPSG
jgi:hypothetical protein